MNITLDHGLLNSARAKVLAIKGYEWVGNSNEILNTPSSRNTGLKLYALGELRISLERKFHVLENPTGEVLMSLWNRILSRRSLVV